MEDRDNLITTFLKKHKEHDQLEKSIKSSTSPLNLPKRPSTTVPTGAEEETAEDGGHDEVGAGCWADYWRGA